MLDYRARFVTRSGGDLDNRVILVKDVEYFRFTGNVHAYTVTPFTANT